MEWNTEANIGGRHATERLSPMEQYLNESDSMKVEVEELELLLGPEDSEVDLRDIFEVCEEEKGSQDL